MIPSAAADFVCYGVMSLLAKPKRQRCGGWLRPHAHRPPLLVAHHLGSHAAHRHPPARHPKERNMDTYGLDLTKNVCEVYGSTGYVATAYTYTPYGQVTATGNVDHPIQWSSEYHDAEPDLVYYNYRYFNANRGRFLSVDPVYNKRVNNSYNIARNSTFKDVDILGLLSVNDVLELADQTETANVKNILIAVEIAILMKACQKAQIELRKAIIKRNRKQVDLWEHRKNIICRYAREASKICL